MQSQAQAPLQPQSSREDLPTDEVIAPRVEAIVRAHLPRMSLTGQAVGEGAVEQRALLPDESLLQHGAGLDSIAVVEVLSECEEAFGISISEELFNESDVTLGRLIEVVRDAVRSREAV